MKLNFSYLSNNCSKLLLLYSSIFDHDLVNKQKSKIVSKVKKNRLGVLNYSCNYDIMCTNSSKVLFLYLKVEAFIHEKFVSSF